MAFPATFVESQGPEPNRVLYFLDADMKSVEMKRLSPKAKVPSASGVRVGAEFFMNTANHTVLMARRESAGAPELHKNETDVMIVRSGGGVLQVGGEIVGRKDSAAGATGTSIRGGEQRRLGPGDIINIPPNVAHNWLLQTGEHVTYVVVKIKELH